MSTLTAVTVNPALVLPIPVVNTDRGITLVAYFRNCDFPVPEKKYIYTLINQLMCEICD